MNDVAIFEKVSFEEYLRAMRASERFNGTISSEEDIKLLKKVYNDFSLPKRSTKGSAGYDFFFPLWDTSLSSHTSIEIPTGIKVKILRDDYWLGIFTKSSLARDYHIRLRDMVSVIDADYYNSEECEGHIFIELVNESDKVFRIKHNTKYAQGIFMEFGKIVGDNTQNIRKGGYGSTSSNDIDYNTYPSTATTTTTNFDNGIGKFNTTVQL